MSCVASASTTNQQGGSSVHLVPHSLPASVASVNYTTQNQMPPLYQQPPVPVFPVASTGLASQSTSSNAASLSLSLPSNQPTAVAAGSMNSLPSNTSQCFVQQQTPAGNNCTRHRHLPQVIMSRSQAVLTSDFSTFCS